ncbi:MAG: hypothetical protein ACT4OX_08435 [Actinomycetota bacterium]
MFTLIGVPLLCRAGAILAWRSATAHRTPGSRVGVHLCAAGPLAGVSVLAITRSSPGAWAALWTGLGLWIVGYLLAGGWARAWSLFLLVPPIPAMVAVFIDGARLFWGGYPLLYCTVASARRVRRNRPVARPFGPGQPPPVPRRGGEGLAVVNSWLFALAARHEWHPRTVEDDADVRSAGTLKRPTNRGSHHG